MAKWGKFIYYPIMIDISKKLGTKKKYSSLGQS